LCCFEWCSAGNVDCGGSDEGEYNKDDGDG